MCPSERAFRVLNMRLPHEPAPPASRPPSDGSTSSRIRDAAVDRFAHEGFDASVRSIAADAGVSPGLVIQRFGSKDGLHAACDAYVLDWIAAAKHASLGRAATGGFLQALAEVDDYAPLLGYIIASLRAGGEVASTFVDQMIADAHVYTQEAVMQGLIKPSVDEEARVRYLVLSSLGAMLLSLGLNQRDGAMDHAAAARIFLNEQYLPMIELYTQGLMSDRRLLDDYLLYIEDPPSVSDSPTANPEIP